MLASLQMKYTLNNEELLPIDRYTELNGQTKYNWADDFMTRLTTLGHILWNGIEKEEEKLVCALVIIFACLNCVTIFRKCFAPFLLSLIYRTRAEKRHRKRSSCKCKNETAAGRYTSRSPNFPFLSSKLPNSLFSRLISTINLPKIYFY